MQTIQQLTQYTTPNYGVIADFVRECSGAVEAVRPFSPYELWFKATDGRTDGRYSRTPSVEMSVWTSPIFGWSKRPHEGVRMRRAPIDLYPVFAEGGQTR